MHRVITGCKENRVLIIFLPCIRDWLGHVLTAQQCRMLVAIVVVQICLWAGYILSMCPDFSRKVVYT